MLFGEAQGERTAHGQSADEDDVACALQLHQRPISLGVPVLPPSEIHVLPAGAMPGQSRDTDGVALRGQLLSPGGHRLGGAGEAVQKQDACGAAVGGIGLGTGEERHVGLL